MKKKPQIQGFLSKHKTSASGGVYTGRFTCPDVQWTADGTEALATFTITAEELADAADSHLIWTDQDVQRGIRPGLRIPPRREISVGDGYPDPALYIFDAPNADDMVDKLLAGGRLFLGPLVWNLRPGKFQAYWDVKASDLYVYGGKVYLPDSHHRQQAIVKAVRTWRDAPASFPKFSGSKQFKVELYFLSREDEGNYFFDKNQRPKPTAMSKAYDLTTLDDLSLLAKQVISKSMALSDNVNRVTDRLTAKNPQVITLSTLREMMKALANADYIDPVEMEGLSTVAATFYDLLAGVRPELGRLDTAERRQVRSVLLVDAAVMMHGYAGLMHQFNDSMARVGLSGAKVEWKQRIERLSAAHRYRFGGWSGDFFEKRNPVWQLDRIEHWSSSW